MSVGSVIHWLWCCLMGSKICRFSLKGCLFAFEKLTNLTSRMNKGSTANFENLTKGKCKVIEKGSEG